MSLRVPSRRSRGAPCDNEGRGRFNAIKRALPGISQMMVTQGLGQLERNGLVDRRVLTESPFGVEYSITKLGDTLETPVAAVYENTSTHSSAVRAAQTRTTPSDRLQASRRPSSVTARSQIRIW
jgi:DNA-binding HxlR family transcriptional regulator